MANVSFMDSSRLNWSIQLPDDNQYPGHDRVKIGCLMRIANATEAMARSHTELINENTRQSNYIKRLEGYLSAERNKVRGLRGQITKLKKIIAAKDEQ